MGQGRKSYTSPGLLSLVVFVHEKKNKALYISAIGILIIWAKDNPWHILAVKEPQGPLHWPK